MRPGDREPLREALISLLYGFICLYVCVDISLYTMTKNKDMATIKKPGDVVDLIEEALIEDDMFGDLTAKEVNQLQVIKGIVNQVLKLEDSRHPGNMIETAALRLIAAGASKVVPSELLTKKEAASLLKVTTITIDNFARQGRLNRHYVGKSVRFMRSEVMAIVLSNEGR